jgi:hypothetical protein
MKMNIGHGLFLTLLSLAGCILGSLIVLLFAMFMVTDDPAWEFTVPIGIIVVNILSLPLYRRILRSGWRYLYNICATLLVTAISFYGAIEWTNSIHSARGSKALLIQTLTGVALALSGMILSVRRSRARRTSFK